MKLSFKECPGHLKFWNDTDMILEHFISTETQDSGGDIMLAAGMKIRGAPVVLFQHGMDIKFGNEPIAKVLDIRVGEHEGKKGLIARTQYYDGSHLTPPDNTGRRLYEKAKDGTMPNWSIGFNSVKEKPTKGGRIVEEWDLHEYSQVAVGMNAEARTLAMGPMEHKFVVVTERPVVPEEFGTIETFMEKTKETAFEDVASFVCKEGVCTEIISDEMKPYPNEHACRINEPSKFSKFRRQNAARDHDGKKYDVIFGQLKGSDKWDEQAYRYPKDKWSAEQAAAHCKSHEGSFEAAKASSVPETKVAPFSLRAHKAIHAFHAALLADLKEHATKEGFLADGAEKCAKEALDDFGENVTPHVEKYVKAVREMAADATFGDEESTPVNGDDDGDEKGYQKSASALRKCTTSMVKAIREHKGNKETVPKIAAEKCVKDHHEAALPHAADYIKAWYEKVQADKAKPETKPNTDQSSSADPAAGDKAGQRVFSIRPPALVKVRAPKAPATRTVRVNLGAGKPSTQITPELVKELVSAATAAMTETLRAEMRKLAGKVT